MGWSGLKVIILLTGTIYFSIVSCAGLIFMADVFWMKGCAPDSTVNILFYQVVDLIFCAARRISLLLISPIKAPFFTTAYLRMGELRNSIAASTTLVVGENVKTLVDI